MKREREREREAEREREREKINEKNERQLLTKRTYNGSCKEIKKIVKV